jgi:ketosteroid isomerase-like protein
VPRRLIERFVEAFNDEDFDALAALLDPHAEIQTRRGLVIGREEAREWATRNPDGHLHQHLELEEVREDGHPAVAMLKRQWRWKESDELADEEQVAVLVSVKDGRIARWQPFEDRAEALRAAGLEG